MVLYLVLRFQSKLSCFLPFKSVLDVLCQWIVWILMGNMWKYAKIIVIFNPNITPHAFAVPCGCAPPT